MSSLCCPVPLSGESLHLRLLLLHQLLLLLHLLLQLL
jgi:hypothetical protein